MIHRHYNPCHITNSGERAADRKFILPPGMESEPVHILHQLRIGSRFHKTQKSGDCDFLVFTRLGILEIEVKGGVIGFGGKEKGFFRLRGEDQEEPIKNPFRQAEDSAGAVLSFLREKGIFDVFVGSLACFPECAYINDGIDRHTTWHLGSGKDLVSSIFIALAGQAGDYKEKHSLKNPAFPVAYHDLDEAKMLKIIDLLKPGFNPGLYFSHARANVEESERKSDEILHVLHGLNGNRRIMVQGPPGSGKTTYALDIINRFCGREAKKGLYLCWNELLAERMREAIKRSDPDLDEKLVTISPLYNYIGELADITADPMLRPTYDRVKNNEFRVLASEIIKTLSDKKSLPQFDFLIADEAHDLFGKGLDLLIANLLGDNPGFEKGNYFIFYDDRQAYPRDKDQETYIRTRDLLKAHCAHYQLFSNLRIQAGHGLSDLISDAGNAIARSDKKYGDDVIIRSCQTPTEVLNYLLSGIDREMQFGKFRKDQMVVLLSSGLIKPGNSIRQVLENSTQFETLQPCCVQPSPGKTGFTSILKSKGLEWEVVFLVCDDFDNPFTQHQIFIGASRAKVKLYLCCHSKTF